MFAKALLTTFALALFARAQDAASDAAYLEAAHLVGPGGAIYDVANYAPTVGVQLTFDDAGFDIEVLPGVLLNPDQTGTEPTVALSSQTDISGSGYLVAMLDLRNSADPSQGMVRHWLGTNYVATAGNNGLYTLTPGQNSPGPYAGPGPAAGDPPHNYTILIFQQPSASIDAPRGDQAAPFLGFNIVQYVASIPGLNLVGGTYFRCGPTGTVPNNGTYTPPALGGGPTGSSTGTGTVSGTGTTTGNAPHGTSPGGGDDAARALGVGAGIVGVVAAFAAALVF